MAKSKTYFEQFLDYFKNKISYKVLRMELINEIKHKKRNSKNKESAPALEMSFLEQNFSFFLINTGVLNIFLKRKNGSFIYIFGTTTLFCSYTYLIFVFYGEERFFYRNSLRSDEIGLYLRKK